MRRKLQNLFQNELFRLLMQGVFAYIAYTAVIIATLQTPPEAILDTNMVEVVRIFDAAPFDET